MTTFPFLILFAALPGFWTFGPMDLSIGDGYIAVDDQIGAGPPPAEGDLLTVTFEVQDGLGRQIANSERRGLPYTLAYGEPVADPILGPILQGMRAGGMRSAWVSPHAVGDTAGDLIPPSTEILVRLKLVTVTKRR